MTDQPTPEEWMRDVLDELHGHIHDRQVFEFIRNELDRYISGLEAIIYSVPTTPVTHHNLQVATHSLKEVVKTLSTRIQESNEAVEALEHIIIDRDMSEGALGRALAEARNRRERDEPQ